LEFDVRSARHSLVVAILCGFAAVACTSSPDGHIPSPSGSTPSVSPTDPQAGVKAEVVARYVAFWATVERLGRVGRYTDPALAEVAVDPQFSKSREFIYAHARVGQTIRGHVEVHPVVVTVTGRSAVVFDCQGGSLVAFTKDGRPVGTPGPSRILGAKVTLVLREGTWRVAGVDYQANVRCIGTQPVLPSPSSLSSSPTPA
jgi:hypothetical protein